MVKTDRLNELAAMAAKDSIEHGYKDADKPIFRLLTKAAVEMAEAVNAYRDKRNAGKRSYEATKASHEIYKGEKAKLREVQIFNYRAHCSNSVQDEMADVAIYLLVLAGHRKVDLKVKVQVSEADIDPDFITNAGYIMGALTGYPLTHDDNLKEVLSKLIVDVIRYLECWMRRDYNQSLEYWIEEKMAYNRLRPYLHGRNDDPTL